MDARAWLDADVSRVPGVSSRAAATLGRVFNIATVADLLEHYPHQGKYREIGEALPLAAAELGQPVTIVGTIRSWNVLRPRRRSLTIAKAVIVDEEGGRVEASFFNQEWRTRQTPAGTRVAVSGVLERYRSAVQIRNAKLAVLGEAEQFDDRVVATYPATEALSSARLAAFVAAALEGLPPLPDHLPAMLRQRRGLLDLDTAVRLIHRPDALADIAPARERLVYDELLCLQIGLQQRRFRLQAAAIGLAHGPVADGLAQRLLDSLPFTPTGAQTRAFAEIAADLAVAKPMHRLLQGDVGAGKTLVAAWTMLAALDAGRQAVLMAPTEVLAEQHLRTFTALLAPLGVNVLDGPRLELLTGGTAASRRRLLLAELAVGDVGLLIGTHALLEERVMFADLGVVVVDEQHRFGVEHRTRLRDKRRDERSPDVLVMTATPIPRSLALTLYGDLDVTVLDESPPGRGEIVTQVVASDSPRRERLYEFVRERAALDERTFVVCPLIEESDVLQVPDGGQDGASTRSVAAAVEVHRRLASEVFPGMGVALVHGRLPAAQRDAAMEDFRRGTAQVLVATTVIEVGVDVPQATIMIIEDADRFGISQLHQLRGRIGRGPGSRNFCVLFSSDPAGSERLRAVAATRDGFRLAETDLELRGEGSLFDTRQSGLPDLRLASLARDYQWVVWSRADAAELVAADPDLVGHPALAAEVRRRYGEHRLAALDTG